MDIEIKQIKPEETYELRQNVLWPNLSIKDVKFEEDVFWNSFHLGAFYEGNLIGITSFLEEKHRYFDEENQFRMRGMATLEDYRGQQVSTKLLLQGEKILNEKNARLLWGNVRVSAVDFYKKFGLREYGKVFDVDFIGPHVLMYKKL